jgi:YhcH/YjgK/YiaL family protein
MPKEEKMIYDKLENAKYYLSVSPWVKKALEYLQSTDLKNLPLGKYPIDGDNVIVSCIMKTTKPYAEAKLETHDKYLDLHYLVEGKEDILCGFLQDTVKVTEDMPEIDCRYYDGPSKPFTIGNDRFIIVFPTDIHAPGLSHKDGEVQTNKKIIVKIRV